MAGLEDISLSWRDRAAIAAATRVVRQLAAVDEVILFGSKARGDDDPESDIDLLVLTRRTLTRAERHRIIDALFPIQIAYDIVLSPVFISSNEWRSGLVSALPIRSEVNEQGVRV